MTEVTLDIQARIWACSLVSICFYVMSKNHFCDFLNATMCVNMRLEPVDCPNSTIWGNQTHSEQSSKQQQWQLYVENGIISF